MLPSNLKTGIDNYIDHGQPVGSFLEAVLENNLTTAVVRADTVSQAHLRGIVMYVLRCAPQRCNGDAITVQDWITLHKANPELAEQIASEQRQKRQEYKGE